MLLAHHLFKAIRVDSLVPRSAKKQSPSLPFAILTCSIIFPLQPRYAFPLPGGHIRPLRPCFSKRSIHADVYEVQF